MATKDFVDYSPASGSNNGSIDITAQWNPQTTPRSTAIAIEGGGLFKTIAVYQNPQLPIICNFGRNSSNYDLWPTIKIDAIGIEGVAYCTTVDGPVVKKKFNNTINIAESEHYILVTLNGRRVNDISKAITFNMQTTLDFTGAPYILCELFTNINFNSTRRNTKIDVSQFYETLVRNINDALDTHPDNHMSINFNIVDFDEAAKERIRSRATCERLVVAF